MPRYEALTAATDAFCKAELTEEYAELARRAIAALCRKRPSPVSNGTVNAWACGVVYALCQDNFLFDAASSPCISPKQLGDAFCVAASTGAAKAKIVRDALGMGPFEHRWLLEGNAANNPALWMIFVDGFAMDVRNASRATPNRWHDCRRKCRKCGS